MAMTNSNGSTYAAINVTPLIDVLLVLLIIFMVIQPAVQRGLQALVPHPPRTSATEPDPRTLVVTVDQKEGAPAYAINGQPIPSGDLGPALQNLLQRRGRAALFVRGSAALSYGAITPVLNLAATFGADGVGLVTPATLAQ